MTDQITWLSTKAAATKLGITLRSLYKAIDEGKIQAFHMGRVIRLRNPDVDAFIEASKVEAGTLRHLYPDTKKRVKE